MAKILITGATGFIGSWLTKFFLERTQNVIIHGSSKKSIENLKNQLNLGHFHSNNYEFWEQDFLKEEWEFPDFSKIDFIIHCAAATKVREGIVENYEKYFGLNIIATKILAKKALKENIKHFIYLSTGQVFGIPNSFPITEDTPKNPINLYGYTKLIGEKVVHSLGILGLNYSIIRPFSIYGKGHYNIISIITDKLKNKQKLTIYGDGTQSRAFLHINDFSYALELILNNSLCYGEEYNLSGLREFSVNELIELISNKLDQRPDIIYKKSNVNELHRNIADLNKIRALGFLPKRSLEDFIEKFL